MSQLRLFAFYPHIISKHTISPHAYHLDLDLAQTSQAYCSSSMKSSTAYSVFQIQATENAIDAVIQVQETKRVVSRESDAEF